MERLSLIRTSLIALGLVLGTSPSLQAQQAGEEIVGVIQEVELSGSPRTVTVQTAAGQRVSAPIANRTRVVFGQQSKDWFPDPHVSQLRPGMTIRFKYDPDSVARIHVEDVPQELRPEPAEPEAPIRSRLPRSQDVAADEPAARKLKARLLDMDEARGDFRADVAGRRESFRAENPRLLRRFAEGDLVVLTLSGEGVGERVTDIQPAALSGRVQRVDSRRREIVIEVDGASRRYGVDDKRLLDDVRVGDKVRFEFEDRRDGTQVITAIY